MYKVLIDIANYSSQSFMLLQLCFLTSMTAPLITIYLSLSILYCMLFYILCIYIIYYICYIVLYGYVNLHSFNGKRSIFAFVCKPQNSFSCMPTLIYLHVFSVDV